MSRLPRVTGKEVLSALQREGFVLTHVRGSHYYLKKSGVSGLIVVPVHGNRTLPAGTLRSILRQAGMDAELGRAVVALADHRLPTLDAGEAEAVGVGMGLDGLDFDDIGDHE